MNWDNLQNSLLDYFNKGKNDKLRTLEITALKIDELYVQEIKNSGKEQYGNSVINITLGPLAASLRVAMKQAFTLKIGPPVILNNTGLLGITQTWSGGLMGLTNPPPGSVSVVTNVVTVPGTMFPMNIPGQAANSSENIFIKELIVALKRHAATVSGICTALVQTPAGALIPTPFPWVGIL